jgi:hypothetical protein
MSFPFQTNRIEIFHASFCITFPYNNLSRIFPSNPIRFVSQKHMFFGPLSPVKNALADEAAASPSRKSTYQRTERTIPHPSAPRPAKLLIYDKERNNEVSHALAIIRAEC